MKTINWGIIGCGDVTEVKSGPAFNKVPRSKLVAVMRRNEEKVKDYAHRHNVPKWYTDANALINDPDITAIYVATPPLQHEEYTIAALRAGKPVYVEKPMTLTAASAKRMLTVAEETGTPLSIAHYRREQPLFKKIKELIDTKAIGEVRNVSIQLYQPHQSNLVVQTETNWRVDSVVSGGGLFHDQAPHQLDLMIYFFGHPKKACGFAVNQSKLYEADDCVTGTIIFQSNVLFNGSWCFNTPPEEARDECEIIGSKGKIGFSVFNHKPLALTINKEKKEWQFEKLTHVQQPMIEQVVSYFLGDNHNPCSAKEGLEVMKILDAFTIK